jgi:hypothetical protein
MPITTQASSPYFDDFNTNNIESKNYQSILFKPGYSVQNRELNQLQSMLRSQLDKFGSAFYTNGSAVVDGLVTFNKDIRFVDIPLSISSNVESIKILSNSLGVKADVIGYELMASTPSVVYRFFIRYRTSETLGGENSVFTVGEGISADDSSDVIGNVELVGYAITAFANRGIFFINGCFVLNEAQQIFLSLADENALFDGLVIFKITESIVTANTDNTLYDNATGAPNFSAPGADRQAISLELKFVNEEPDYDFTKLLIIANSEVVSPARSSLNILNSDSLNNILATRTYEESGNYAVRPFKLALREHYNTGSNFGKYNESQLSSIFPEILPEERVDVSKSKYVACVEPSVAYVKGYRVSLTDRKDLTGNKARYSEEIKNVSFTAAQGNYILTTSAKFASNSSLPDICNASLTYGLFQNATGGGSQIGTCKIRNIEQISSGVFQIFIYDLVFSGSRNLSSAKSLSLDGTPIGSGTGTGARFVNSAGFALYDSGNNTNIFKFPFDAVKTISSLRYGVRKTFTNIQPSNTTITIGGVATTGHWVIIPHPSTVNPSGIFESSSATDYIIIDHSGVPQPITQVHINTVGVHLLAPAISTTSGQTCSVVAPYIVNDKYNSKSSLTSVTQNITSGTFAEIANRTAGVWNSSNGINYTGHGLSNGDRITFSVVSNATNVFTNTTYYVKYVDANSFQLTLTRGATALVVLSSTNNTAIGTWKSNSIIALSNMDVVASSVQVQYPVSWLVDTNKVVRTAHGLVNGDKISFSNLGTATGISTGTTYYVRNKTNDNFELSLTIDGDIIDITGANTTGGSMILSEESTRFLIEDGTNRNNFNETLLVANTTIPTTAPFSIIYDYYPHSLSFTTGTPYIVNSYDDDDLENIPLFEDNRLTDSIDFRFDDSATSVVRLDSNSTIVATIEYYLPRVDNILVNSSGQFYISEGAPSLKPKAPAVPEDSMSLYSLYIPAYTYTTDSISAKMIDNRRYTMRDIGDIEKRVSNIEYYTSLSLLEKSAQDKQILTAGGLERFKNGILVDSFFGHNIADVENVGHVCSIDQENGVLRPHYNTNNLDLKISTGGTSQVVIDDNTTYISYTNKVLINQSFATENAESVNPFDMQVWSGTVELSPSSDEWKSTVVRPDVIINDTSAYDAVVLATEESGILGYHWNEWEVNWSGTSVKRRRGDFRRNGQTLGRVKEITTTRSTSIREGTRTTLSYTDNKQSIGEKTVDISYIPFIRSRKIYFKAERLKPNTRVYPFFDGVDISDYTVTKIGSNAVPFVAFKNRTDSTIYDGNNDPLGLIAPTPIISDSTGKASGYFIIPNHSSLKFNTGERSFKLIDSPVNSDSVFTTSAETKYYASGILETKQNTILSTRVPSIDTSRVTKSRTNADVVKVKYVDPLAQSFILDENQIDGAYITKLDLYFQKKSTKGIPVSVYVVSMENGIPTQNILPFSYVTKDAVDVVVANPSILAEWLPTTFEFDAPVYLQPGVEYAFVVVSNDSDYRAYVSEIGKENAVQGKIQVIAKNPYAGVMFKSQNGSTWSADQSKDMTFKLYRAQFNTSSTLKTVNLKGFRAVGNNDTLSFSSIKTTISNIVQNNTQILWKLTINDINEVSPLEYNININETINFDRRFTTYVDGITLTGYLNTNTQYLSPIIDNDRMSVLLIDNEINNDVTNEIVFDKGAASARYITRNIDLNDPANQLNVYIAVNRPTASENVLVYVKAQIRDEAIYSNEPWVLLSPSTILPISSETENYSEISYTYSPERLFSRFTVKIVLTSSEVNGANVPTVKDFRAIATYGA